jgi:two-component system, NtrC family, sensor kinase
MLARWPIRNKLLLGVTLLLVIVGTLSLSGFLSMYAYRGLVKSLRSRADELPLATTLSQQVSDLRAVIVAANAERQAAEVVHSETASKLIEEEFQVRFLAVENTLAEYREQLATNEDERIGDTEYEFETANEIEQSLKKIATLTAGSSWGIDRSVSQELGLELERAQTLTAQLPSHLHRRLGVLAGEVRAKYRALIGTNAIATLLAAVLLALFIRLFYRWVFQPLRQLIQGSRQVAAGDFSYRIRLDTQDEMAELAGSMNEMTERFQLIRDDLDRQVQIRTKQVVRSEQLASVGFLAAGVAHEINNPLASIAMCAESLEGRLPDVDSGGDQLGVMKHYLQMIQDEAFRCKGITEKLLDFSRIGEVKHQNTDLAELVASVIEMVRHLGKYHDRQVAFDDRKAGPVIAAVNPQEIKQVVLNLVTNALDSLDAGGELRIELSRTRDKAELMFIDNGCGMTDEVLAHLFEPFFTRKRGGSGTGLGLSIVHRIVNDHGGQIEAESDGPGRGSRFRVTLPLSQTKEKSHRYQAA